MLYLTTRSKTDSFTAHRVLHSDVPQCGGFFVPLRLPEFTNEDFISFKDASFAENVARILNLFFGTSVSGWDIDFAVGRYAVKLVHMSHRIFVLETWHNHDADHSCYLNRLYRLFVGDMDSATKPGHWFATAVDIALLFAVFGQLLKRDISQFNVAFPSGDLQKLLAVRYAQRMGLPIVVVAIGADEREDIWELVYHGNYSTKRDKIPDGLEQLIYFQSGHKGVNEFLQICRRQGNISFENDTLETFSVGLFASVVGKSRIQNVVANVKRSCGYDINLDAACGYAALQDCRVRTTGGLDAVLFSTNGLEE